RFGPVPVITGATVVTVALVVVLAAAKTGPFLIIVLLIAIYLMAGFGDTATLASGIVEAAASQYRGATLAVYALTGFAGGMAGPVTFGAVLDWTGGRDDPNAWSWAFASLAIGAVITAAALHLRRRR
ncbi:MAG: hypothetical protein MJE12_07155, partial [Alphaproteobacteria bacterium]|nr:hypothetical protein [Alphaproteobacteria bacterium]